MAGAYKAGGFAVPAATGTVAVSGLGFECQGVIFFGSNRSEEDTLVTDANAGVFMGLMAGSTSGLLAQCDSVIPQQGYRASGTEPILMQSTFNVVEYAASPVSLDVDGFTVNFTSVPISGARWIHYLAWGGWDNSDAARVTQAAVTLSVGFEAQCIFAAGTVSYGGGPGDWIRPDLPQFTFATWGGGSASTAAVDQALLATVRTTGYGQGFQGLWCNEGWTGFGAFYIGPFLGQAPQAGYATSATDIYLNNSTGLVNSTLWAFWTGPAISGCLTPNATSGGDVIEPLGGGIVLPEALIILGACGREIAFDTLNPDNGVSFGIVTDDYQGCVVANMDGNYFYQSRVQGFASNAASGGVNAGTVVLNDDSTFTATTAEDTATPQNLAYIAFGPGAEDEFVPHIYRWLKRS